MSSKTRIYATAKHPTIEAVLYQLYRYPTKAKAIERFKSLCEHFVLAKDQPESTASEPVAILWIKGFGVTEEENSKGYTGQYAELRVATTGKGLYTLSATLVEKPLSSHPQKKRLKSTHPNWGHPVMRSVKKQKKYESLEAAQAELEQLHTEFPETSIPGLNKLFVIIYEKREGVKRPTHKIALEIKAHTEGGYVIHWRDNEKTAKPKLAAPDTEAAAAADAPKTQQGYFTSMVSLKKKRKLPAAKKKPDGDA